MHYSGDIAKALDKYRKAAQKQASNHRPTSDSTDLDENEAEVVSLGNQHVAAEHSILDHFVTEVSRSTAELKQKVVGLRTRFEQLLGKDGIVGPIEAILSEERTQMTRLTEQRLRAETAWRYFRTQNEIHEDAQYPESKIFHWSIIAALVMAEVIVNAFFYENAAGLMGGVVVAIGVSAIGILLSVGCGLGFRYKNLAQRNSRVIGWLSLAVFIVATIFLNLLFAAFRSEYQTLTDPNDSQQLRHAFTAALQQASGVIQLRFPVSDFMSFILFMLGSGLAVLAFWKAYRSDDQYPGYSKRDRTLKQAVADEEATVRRLRDRISGAIQQRMSELQSALHEPSTLISAATQRSTSLDHSHRELQTYCDAIAREVKLVIETYRQANTAVRATPTPKYFEKECVLTQHPDRSLDIQHRIGELKVVQEDVQLLRSNYESQINSAIKSTQADATSIQNELIPKFLKELEANAQAVINRQTPSMRREAAAG